MSRENVESQAADTMSSANTLSYFPLSSDSDGGEGDVPARKTSHVLPPRESYLSGNEVTTERTHGQTWQAQPLSAKPRGHARSEIMALIIELQSFGEALLTEAAGPGVTFEITTDIEHAIQWGTYGDFGLTVESTPHPGESYYDFRSPNGMLNGHIESTPQNMTELRDSKHAEYWTRPIKSKLEGHAAFGIFLIKYSLGSERYFCETSFS